MSFEPQLLWAYAHILLLVYWLGADVGLFLVMAWIKDRRLDYATRVTLIRLAFYIDLAPRTCVALILPVGMHLAAGLGVAVIPGWLFALAWVIGLGWTALHVALVVRKGTPLAARLRRLNNAWEFVAGALFIGIGAVSLATGAPVAAGWFALKLLLFGLVFWVILGIDTRFQPFTTLLRLGERGLDDAAEAAITRATNLTMAWALLLYGLVLAIAFLGKVKPFW
jgi:hypothetical protein